jgi:hypothetical protein
VSVCCTYIAAGKREQVARREVLPHRRAHAALRHLVTAVAPDACIRYASSSCLFSSVCYILTKPLGCVFASAEHAEDFKASHAGIDLATLGEIEHEIARVEDVKRVMMKELVGEVRVAFFLFVASIFFSFIRSAKRSHKCGGLTCGTG